MATFVRKTVLNFDIGLVYSTITRFSATSRATRGLLEHIKGRSIGEGRRKQVTNEQSDSMTTIDIIDES